MDAVLALAKQLGSCERLCFLTAARFRSQILQLFAISGVCSFAAEKNLRGGRSRKYSGTVSS